MKAIHQAVARAVVKQSPDTFSTQDLRPHLYGRNIETWVLGSMHHLLRGNSWLEANGSRRQPKGVGPSAPSSPPRLAPLVQGDASGTFMRSAFHARRVRSSKEQPDRSAA